MISNLYEGVVDVCQYEQDKLVLLTISGALYCLSYELPIAKGPSMTKVFALD